MGSLGLTDFSGSPGQARVQQDWYSGSLQVQDTMGANNSREQVPPNIALLQDPEHPVDNRQANLTVTEIKRTELNTITTAFLERYSCTVNAAETFAVS